MGKSYKYNGLEVANGNLKLGEDTLIINMGTATDCPSRKLGLCKLGNKCYALKSEKRFPSTTKGPLACRMRQANYWQANDGHKIALDFIQLLEKYKALKARVKYLRVNESGDFYGQADVEKLSTVARILKDTYGIQTYTYTARADLDFTKACFVVKGSGHGNGNNGMTIARSKKAIAKNLKETEGTVADFGQYYENKKFFAVCPMDCRECVMCKEQNGMNVVFPLH